MEKERGRKGKAEGREEVEGEIWPTQKFWRGTPYDHTHRRSPAHTRMGREDHLPAWEDKTSSALS